MEKPNYAVVEEKNERCSISKEVEILEELKDLGIVISMEPEAEPDD